MTEQDFSTDEDLRALYRIFETVNESTVLDNFTPNEGGQVGFCSDTIHHQLIMAGGNGSGKSFCGMVRGGWHTVREEDEDGRPTGKTIHPYMDLRIPTTGVEGWMSSYSQDVQTDNLMPIFDRVMGPYVIERDIREGIMHRAKFEGIDSRYPSWWNCKWITQGVNAYKGSKKNFVYMDEPHPHSIWNEIVMRFTKTGGFMWICLTPVVDPENPLLARDVLWMLKDLVEPWERNPASRPELAIYYVDMDENARYTNVERNLAMMAGMSELEIRIRKTGMFAIFTGRTCFDREMLLSLRTYLMEHIEEATPTYGSLIHDDTQPVGQQVKFIASPDQIDFPDSPEGYYGIKIWERPVQTQDMQRNPGYVIAVDVAEGKPGGDYTAAYVFRKDTRRIVAAIHGHLSEEQLARELWLLGHYYHDGKPDYRPAWLAIEIRNFGAQTQTYLIRGYKELGIRQYPIGKIFHRPTTPDLLLGLRFMSAPGWDTTKTTRGYVVAGMRRAIVEAFRTKENNLLISIPDLGCINEALGFVQDKSGKWQGHPDDRLFALGIGHEVMDLLESGQGRPDAPQEKPVAETLWRVGRDMNGLPAPALQQSYIMKLLNTAPEHNRLVF